MKKPSTPNVSVVRIKSLPSPEMISKAQTLNKTEGRYHYITADFRRYKNTLNQHRRSVEYFNSN